MSKRDRDVINNNEGSLLCGLFPCVLPHLFGGCHRIMDVVGAVGNAFECRWKEVSVKCRIFQWTAGHYAAFTM